MDRGSSSWLRCLRQITREGALEAEDGEDAEGKAGGRQKNGAPEREGIGAEPEIAGTHEQSGQEVKDEEHRRGVFRPDESGQSPGFAAEDESHERRIGRYQGFGENLRG